MDSRPQQVPEIGRTYYFYDDGKLKRSRQYEAKVLRVVSPEEASRTDVTVQETGFRDPSDAPGNGDMSLIDVWRRTVGSDRNTSCFVGWPYALADSTDYFVACSIPEYDEDTIWFVRTRRGGWYSMNIQSAWQGGVLDVDGRLTEYMEGLCK